VKSPHLSIIMVNWNGREVLEECLLSICEFGAGEDYETIVVDNASTDGSSDFIRRRFSSVHLIQSDHNLGFAGGNNLGARHARGELLLLLNTDTRLLTPLDPGIQSFGHCPRLGALGCLMRDGHNSVRPSYGYFPTLPRLLWAQAGLDHFLPAVMKPVIEPVQKSHHLTKDVDWISGAFLMTPRKLWEQLGGLDERYFMYIEDIDYCQRLKNMKYRVEYNCGIEIVHYGAGGFEMRGTWKGGRALLHSTRGYIKYHQKFSKPFVSTAVYSTLIGGAFIRFLLLSIRSKLDSCAMNTEKADAYWDVLTQLSRGSNL
jgi:N-acetylglucosaminyl-diphospho-decaprenol L-rhamnosyltransferase